MPSVDLRDVVRERTRNIADQARQRARAAADEHAEIPRAPDWLKRVAGYLPDHTRAVLRDALGPDGHLDKARRMLSEVRREAEAIRQRESALDATRQDVEQNKQALEKARFELRGREAHAEKLLARAERAAAEASTERLVPRKQIRFDPADSPRPLRDVARLAANIKRFGQLTPIVVTERADGRFDLVTGYRRMAALAEAGVPHARVRVLDEIDAATAAALYVAENCMPVGISSKAVEKLADRLGDTPGFADVLPHVLADDEGAVEEMYLDDIADEARTQLGEGAAWLAALRPHWADLEPADRRALESLVDYFAKIAARLR